MAYFQTEDSGLIADVFHTVGIIVSNWADIEELCASNIQKLYMLRRVAEQRSSTLDQRRGMEFNEGEAESRTKEKFSQYRRLIVDNPTTASMTAQFDRLGNRTDKAYAMRNALAHGVITIRSPEYIELNSKNWAEDFRSAWKRRFEQGHNRTDEARVRYTRAFNQWALNNFNEGCGIRKYTLIQLHEASVEMKALREDWRTFGFQISRMRQDNLPPLPQNLSHPRTDDG